MKTFVLLFVISACASGQVQNNGDRFIAGNLSVSGLQNGCLDAGSTDAYACNPSPALTAYATGTSYRFKANTVNTGPATINLNALGAKTIVKAAGGITTALADGDIKAGQWVDVVYDGTNMQMQSTLGNASAGGGLGDPGSNGLLKRTALNTTAAATAGTDYIAPGGALGTPSGGTATNITGLPIDGGTTGTLPLNRGGTNCTTPYAINPQTATYQVLAADFTCFKTISVASGTFTITLVASGSQPVAGTWLRILNYGTGVATLARSGQNINGAAANLTIAAGSASAPTGALIVSDGTNYFAQTSSTGSGGTPGGSTTQFQINNGGVFAGMQSMFQTGGFNSFNEGIQFYNALGFTLIEAKVGPSQGNNPVYTVLDSGGAVFGTVVGNSAQTSFPNIRTASNNLTLTAPADIYLGTDISTTKIFIGDTNNQMNAGSGTIFAWTSGASAGTRDTGLARSAAGVVEVNSGTAGTLRDIKTRGTQITPVAVGSLPTCNSGAEGLIRGVTDATSPTFLATIAGGGAVHAPVYCNGTNWVAF